ncbi:MucBP domain-containing protein [Isobaculum melis]|uniref:MucBP domain-containing protein n=1 Tax=Isobaculum melis TaxID=142588 RepID=A0A1H9TKJ4_9LACT|nr:MucBP domain-containing protein [Isobaculum melis]SER97715.1 MucBP domain-containing protein [Isobaculum melis]
MLNRKISKLFILASLVMFFFVVGSRTEANELSEPDVEVATRAGETNAIMFDVKRDGQKYMLENVDIVKSFGAIQSVTIKMPEGVQLSMTVPAGWTSSNRPEEKVINYILTANNTPTDVQNVLKNLNLSIQDETKTKGDINIALSGEKISSWKDPNGVTHYYKFVKKIVPWLDAYNAAKKERYKGLTGYLATITSPEEHSYIFNSIATDAGWLGGTRMILHNGLPIMDQSTISSFLPNYNLQANDWYWASGPESNPRTVFFIGKSKAAGGFAPRGIYNGWSTNPPEPNNNGTGEYVLQFALRGTMWWNDLENGRKDPVYNSGYYVEFSQYGNQKEILDDQNSHSAAIPQLVKVQFLNQENNQPLANEKLTSTVFSLGEPYKAIPKEIEGYDVVVAPSNANGVYGKEPLTVTYYYLKQQMIFHIQQVILAGNNQIVVPSKGYAEIRNVDALLPENVIATNEKVNQLTNSVIGDSNEYTTVHLVRNPKGRYYHIEVIIPEYYQNMGYVLTDNLNTPHSFKNKQTGVPVVDGNGKKEYWITFYLQPERTAPKPYSWDYTTLNIGLIN